jgi:hypothetical protein
MDARVSLLFCQLLEADDKGSKQHHAAALIELLEEVHSWMNTACVTSMRNLLSRCATSMDLSLESGVSPRGMTFLPPFPSVHHV